MFMGLHGGVVEHVPDSGFWFWTRNQPAGVCLASECCWTAFVCCHSAFLYLGLRENVHSKLKLSIKAEDVLVVCGSEAGSCQNLQTRAARLDCKHRKREPHGSAPGSLGVPEALLVLTCSETPPTALIWVVTSAMDLHQVKLTSPAENRVHVEPSGGWAPLPTPPTLLGDVHSCRRHGNSMFPLSFTPSS